MDDIEDDSDKEEEESDEEPAQTTECKCLLLITEGVEAKPKKVEPVLSKKD